MRMTRPDDQRHSLRGPSGAQGVNQQVQVQVSCFKEVFTREDTTEVSEPENLQTESVLTTINFRVSDVRRKIRDLKTDGAAGPDGFSPRVLQELQQEIAPALAAIFTKSMEEGVVPTDWRELT